MAIKVIGNVAGRLPVYCGEWTSEYNGGNGYFDYNEVSYFGSLFINVADGNKLPPCVLVRDERGNLVEYHLQHGWHFAANAMDASVMMTNVNYKTEQVEHNIAYMECDSNPEDQFKIIHDEKFVLSTHVRMIVKMYNANSHSNPKLNINNTGNRPILYNSKPCDDKNTWESGEIVDIFYDGTNYCVTSHEHSANSDIVILSHAEYEALPVKDPKVLYFTYEGGSSEGTVVNGVLILQNDIVQNGILNTTGIVNNMILNV